MDWKKTLILCFVIIVSGSLLTVLIFYTEPTASRSGATKQTAILVDVEESEVGRYNPSIQAIGTVVPTKDIILSPRVSGQIISLSPAYNPGGYVSEGDTLLKIDPKDYEYTLQQRVGELEQARADLAIEMGLQDAAREEYSIYGNNRIYGDSLTQEQRFLFLREPQLNSVKSQIDVAEAAVDMAELNLQRTTVTAPFDAHILTKNVNTGSQVAPGDNLGRLVGLDSYWVETTVTLSKLKWLEFPSDDSETGSEVRIRNRTAWDEGEYRTGYLYKLIGSLENQTRMARVLITFPDPHAREAGDAETQPLMIGSVVEVTIPAKDLDGVARVDRDYIRSGDTIWVMENNELRIRNVNIVVEDAQFAYISEGLSEGDRIVTSDLSTIADGVPLRLKSDETGSDQ